jgi:BlaI family penicillinase repressor
MPRRPSAQPTEVEMQILRILWELGPSPVREIHRRLEAAKGTNYSTTVKMLAVMLQKGLVKRDEKPSRTCTGRLSPGPRPANGCSTT